MAQPTSPKSAPVRPVAAPVPRPPPPEPPTQKRTNIHFVRDLSIFSAVALAGLGFYWKHEQTQTQVNHVAKKAKDLIERDTPQDFYEAEKQLKKALELDSSNAYCLSALAEMNALLWGEDGLADRRAPAEEYTHKADAADPHFQERYSADALVQLYGGQPAKAEATIRAVLDKGARGGRLFDAIGRAQRAQGKLDDARKSFLEATKAGRIPRFNVDLAQLYLDEGDLVNAENFIQKAVDANPDHPRALATRARIVVTRGVNIKTATDDLASLLGPRRADLPPTLLAEAYTARAQLKLFNRQPAEAVRDAEEAVKADAHYAAGHQVLGLAYAQSNNVGQALNEFERAQTLDPYVSAFYFDAAKALSLAGQSDKAVATLQKVVVKDEHYYLAFGDLLDRKGDKAGALSNYDQAIKVNPLSAQAFYGRGKILEEQHKLPEAGTAFEAAFGAQPNFPEAHQHMGYLLLDAKKFPDAGGELETALAQYVANQTPREKLIALRDEFENRLKKSAPKAIAAKFADDVKQNIFH